ncbi:MAG: hypothetical protein GY950_00795 [bacterium]|nr:hypothetical protein [bacterium]
MGQMTHDPYAMAESWVMSQKEKWGARIFQMVDEVRADADYAARVLDPMSEGHNQMVTWLYNNPSAEFEDYYKVGNPGYEQLKTSYLAPAATTEWERTVTVLSEEKKEEEEIGRERREAEYDWYADKEIDDAGDEDIVIPQTPDKPPETYVPKVISPDLTPSAPAPTVTKPAGPTAITPVVKPMPEVVATDGGLNFQTIAMIAGGFLLLNMLRK